MLATDSISQLEYQVYFFLSLHLDFTKFMVENWV